MAVTCPPVAVSVVQPPLKSGDTGLSQTGAGGAISPGRPDGSGRG